MKAYFPSTTFPENSNPTRTITMRKIACESSSSGNINPHANMRIFSTVYTFAKCNLIYNI